MLALLNWQQTFFTLLPQCLLFPNFFRVRQNSDENSPKDKPLFLKELQKEMHLHYVRTLLWELI